MKIYTYISLFLALFILLYLLFRFFFRNIINTNERLNMIENMTMEADSETVLNPSILTLKNESNVVEIPFLGKYLNKISRILTQAHILMKPMEFLFISIISMLLVFLICWIILKNAVLALLFGFLGFFLPRIQITTARDKRAKQLNNQLPEFLNVLSNALRAGLSLNQAIDSASLEMSDPIKWEFQKVMRDNTLGKPLEDALNDMAKRTVDEDLDMFVSAVNIQRQVGGNLSEVLEMIAETIRARVKLKGDVRTMSAQSKLSGIIIGVLPIGLAFVISALNPGYLDPLFNEPIGQFMLIAAGIMMLIGAYLLKKISTLEV